MGTSTVTITDRESVSVTGLTSIISTSCSTCVLNTDTGVLKINGSRLTIESIDLTAGTITISGAIWGVNYTSN